MIHGPYNVKLHHITSYLLLCKQNKNFLSGSLTSILYALHVFPNVPIALYSLLNVTPDDGLMIVRNM